MLKVLQRLRTADLEALSAAIRARRLGPQFGQLALGRYVADHSIVDALSDGLDEALQAGWTPAQIAELAELLVVDRGERPYLDTEKAELVWSGPEMPGAPDRDTPVVVHELFHCAKSEVLVAGYAVYQGARIFRPLAEKMDDDPDLSATFFLDIQRPQGDTSAASELVQRFAHRFRTREWPGERLPELYYDPRSLELEQSKRACLHAKCIVVDGRTALVSSANFTEAAHERNIEAGVLIHGGHLPEQLRAHLRGLSSARLVRQVPF